MPDAMLLRDEIDILYSMSNKLTQAATPAGWLEAVSDYARERGAMSGVLLYLLTDPSGEPETLELAAQWSKDRRRSWPDGAQFPVDRTRSFMRHWLTSPDRPLVISDLHTNETVDPTTRDYFEQAGVRSLIALPLHHGGQWVGLLIFSWREAAVFDERDLRIFTATIQQAAPVIGSVRLSDQNRERARRAERLLQINTALSQATNEAQIVGAVSLYAVQDPPDLIMLSYVIPDADGRPAQVLNVAQWEGGAVEEKPLRMGRSIPIEHFALSDRWTARPEEPVLIANSADDDRVDPFGRELLDLHGLHAIALLPLYSYGRWQGLLSIGWHEPHTFADEEVSIYRALLQTLPSVVASRRAYLDAEEARAEREILYRVSRGINAARTYQEVVDALAQLELSALSIALWAWERFDFERARYLELLVQEHTSGLLPGTRLSLDEIPGPRTLDPLQPMVVEDTRDSAQLDPVTAKTVERSGYRSFLAVSLCLEDRTIGLLSFQSREPRRYTEREKRLAAAIGELVTAAVERIRYRDAIERERGQAEILATVNAALSQASNEQAILDAVAGVVEPYGVALSMLAYSNATEDGPPTGVRTVALRMHGGEQPDFRVLPLASQAVSDSPLLEMTLAMPHEPIFVEDLSRLRRSDERGLMVLARDLAWSSLIALPLKAGDLWHGLLLLVWESPQTFSDDLRWLVYAIRPTLASVVTSRKAYLAQKEAHLEAAQRVLELETVAKISAAATSILDLDRLLSTITDLARASFASYHVDIFLLDGGGSAFVCVPTRDEPLSRIPVDDPRALVARAAGIRQGVMVNDAAIAPRGVLSPGMPGARSEMAVPMIAAKQVIGVLVVQSAEPERFSNGDIRVMSTLADLIAVAVENARLYRAAHDLAVLEERNRLARELHDSVSQALYGIALGARTAQKLLTRDPGKLGEPLDYVLSLAEAGLSEMRALLFELRPELLENDGLQAALAAQVASMQARHQITVDAELCDEPDVSIATKEALYRIAREAMHNTVKHARASHATVRMDCLPDGIILELADDGVGFDPSGVFPGHLGLKSMRERAQAAGATFTLESAPGEGTRIVVEVRRQG